MLLVLPLGSLWKLAVCGVGELFTQLNSVKCHGNMWKDPIHVLQGHGTSAKQTAWQVVQLADGKEGAVMTHKCKLVGRGDVTGVGTDVWL